MNTFILIWVIGVICAFAVHSVVAAIVRRKLKYLNRFVNALVVACKRYDLDYLPQTPALSSPLLNQHIYLPDSAKLRPHFTFFFCLQLLLTSWISVALGLVSIGLLWNSPENMGLSDQDILDIESETAALVSDSCPADVVKRQITELSIQGLSVRYRVEREMFIEEHFEAFFNVKKSSAS